MPNISDIIRNYFKKYATKYIDDWHLKTPKQKWQIVYDTGGLLAESIGVTVFTTLNNYWYSYISDLLGFIYFTSATYTFWYYLEQREYFRGLQGSCAIGIVFACLILQVKTIGPERHIINSLMNFGGEYIYIDERQTPGLRYIRQKTVDKLIRSVVTVVLLIVLAFGMFGFNTAYLIVFKGSRITFLGTELPFVDKDSEIAFWLNISIQCMIAAVGMIGCLAIEIGAALIFNAISAIPLLLHVDLRELESVVKLKGFTLIAKARLRNVFMKAQDFEKIVEGAVEVYYTRLFVGSFLFTYSISFAIFSQLLFGHPSGYGIAFCNYLLLLITCHLGDILEQAKTEIKDELYNMQWYMLPAESQRQICSVIHMVQNGASLTIGPVSKLNMETAADLTKTIYRFTMLVYRTFN